MNIVSNDRKTFYMMKKLQALFSNIASVLIILMSFGIIAGNYYILIPWMVLTVIIFNVYRSLMTKEEAQARLDGAIGKLLEESPIWTSIGLILMVSIFGLLFTGNLFAWGAYLGYVFIILIISNAHDKRLGVSKEKEQD